MYANNVYLRDRLVAVFFQIVYNRVARGMLHDDRITFSMLLCRIYLRGLSGYEIRILHRMELVEPPLQFFRVGLSWTQIGVIH